MIGDMVGRTITNKIKNKNWKNKIDNFKLDPTLNWKFAEITEIHDNQIKIKILNQKDKNLFGIIDLKDIKWTLRKRKKSQKDIK